MLLFALSCFARWVPYATNAMQLIVLFFYSGYRIGANLSRVLPSVSCRCARCRPLLQTAGYWGYSQMNKLILHSGSLYRKGLSADLNRIVARETVMRIAEIVLSQSFPLNTALQCVFGRKFLPIAAHRSVSDAYSRVLL